MRTQVRKYEPVKTNMQLCCQPFFCLGHNTSGGGGGVHFLTKYMSVLSFLEKSAVFVKQQENVEPSLDSCIF